MKSSTRHRVRPNFTCPLSSNSISYLRALAVTVLAFILFGNTVDAQNTWDGGGGDNNWGTGVNWNFDTAPANDGTANLHFAGALRAGPVMEANYNINSLTFDSTGLAFNITNAPSTSLTIQAGITNNDGSLQTISITNIILGAAQTWSAAAGALTVSGNIDNGGFLLTVNAATATILSGGISGTGGLTKIGASTLTLSGATANTYTGVTTVTAGTLTLSKTGGAIAIAGDLAISGTVTLTANNQIATTSAVTITGGTLGLGAFSNAISSLTMTAGTVSGTGTLTNGNVTTLASGTAATISATRLDLGGATRTFDVADGGAASDLTISSIIRNGGLTKDGAGTLTLSAVNLYTGKTTINAGTLSIAAETGLGADPGVFTADQLTLNGGTLDASVDLVIDDANRGVTLGASGGTFNTTAGGTALVITEPIAGTGGLTKTGAGSLTLNGASANTYSGVTTVNAGTLVLGKTGGAIAVAGDLVTSGTVTLTNNNQIATTSAVTINTGGTLGLGAFSNAITSLTMTAGTVSGTGTLTNGNVTTLASGTGATIGSGRLDLGGAVRTFTIAEGGADPDLTISAVIQNGGLTKAGAGKLSLTGVNTYTGKTTINAGILTISAETGLGADPGIFTADQLTLDGGTLQGSVTIDDSNRGITLAAGGGTFNQTGTMTVASPITGAGALTKTGTGTLVLSGALANDYTGVTTVNEGTLILTKTNVIAIAGNLVVGDGTLTDTVTLARNDQIATTSAVTINLGGVLGLGAFSNAITSLTMTAGTVSGTGTLTNGDVTTLSSGTTATIGSGRLDLNGSTRTITVANGGADPDLTISAIIQNGGITKEGAGTLALNGANTYAGATTINAGTVELGNATGLGTTAAGTTVADGAVLDLNGQTVGAEAVTLNGTGISGGGALINSSGTAASLSGAVTLNTASSVGGSGALTLSGVISGTGIALTKVGTGNLTLTGSANTYTGTTTVNAGTLTLNKAVGVTAIAGDLVVGDGSLTDTVTVSAANQIADTSAVTVNSSGVLAFGANSEAIGSLTIVGGSVTLGTGATLTNLGALTVTGGSVATGTGNLRLGGDVTGNAAATTATITGNLNLGGATRTFTIADGAADPDMAISAVIDNGGLTKAGAGKLTLSGANNYTGTTTLSAGTLRATTSLDALGTGASTLVLSGGTLELANSTGLGFGRNTTVSGDVTIVTEDPGGGAGNTHTLGTLSIGANTLTVNEAGSVSGNQGLTFGAVTLTGAPTFLVNTNGGGATTLLTLGAIANGGNLLTFDGTGNSTVTGIISGTGGVTKKGTGTLSFGSVLNTFGGVLTIENGTLVVGIVNSNSVAGPLGNSANAVVMGPGADPFPAGTLEYIGATASTDKPFTLNFGGGVFQITNPATVLTLHGAISGSSGLTKTGPGTLVLANAAGFPNYSGATTINGGVLRLNNNLGTSMSGNFEMNGGVLEWQEAAGFTLTRSLGSGGGAMQLPGGVSGFSAFEGTFTVNIGGSGSTVQWGSTFFNPTTFVLNALTANTNIVFVNGLDLNAANRTINVLTNVATISGVIGNTGVSPAGLVKGGSGKLILSANNTYDGTMTISGGILQIGDGGTTGTLGSGDVTNNAALVFNRSDAVTIANVIRGTGTLTNVGTTTLTLSGNNTYSGATALVNAGGILRATHSNAFGSTAGGVFVPNGTAVELIGGIAVGAEALSLAGTGIGGAGALRNISGDNSWAGTITVQDSPTLHRINSDAGTLTLSAIGEAGGAAKTLVFGGAGNIVVNGVIGGGADLGIAKDGTGTLTLSGVNTYSVLTALTNGTLRATTSTSALGAAPLSLAGGVLELANDTGLNFGRATTVFADTTIRSDRLTSGAGVTHTLSTLSIGAQILTVTNGANVASGTAGLTFSGAVTLTGASTFLVNEGAGVDTLLTFGSTVANGGFLLTFDGTGDSTVTGIVSGTGGLTKKGAGKLTLSGANTFTGVLTIENGTLSVGTVNSNAVAGPLGNSANAVVMGGSTGTLEYTGASASSNKKFTMATGGTGAFQIDGAGTTLTLFGVIDGSGALMKTGPGTLALAAANTFTGGVGISAGVLQVNNPGALNGNAVAMTGGTLRLNGNSVTIAGLSGSAGTVENNNAAAATLTVNKTAGSDTFSGVIQNGAAGTLALNKTGAGTLELAGANTYTGGTTLTAGTLKMGAGDVLPSSGTFDFAGGVLDANNQTDTTIGGLTLSASSTLLFHAGGGNGQLTFATASRTGGTLTITGWEGFGNAAGTGDTLFVGGLADQAFLDNIFWTELGVTGAIQLGGAGGEIVPVPEPINVALGIFGAVVVVFGIGRRLRARACRQS